jgi:hypothetical protein
MLAHNARGGSFLGAESTASSGLRCEPSGDGPPELSSVNDSVRNNQNGIYTGAEPLIESRCIYTSLPALVLVIGMPTVPSK